MPIKQDSSIDPSPRSTFEIAIDWYLDRVGTAQAPPLSASDAATLRTLVTGERPWSPTLFAPFVTFGHTLSYCRRLLPDVPRFNLGDAISLVNLLHEGSTNDPVWIFDPAVCSDVVTKLNVRHTSQGIAQTQRDNRAGWWAHAERSRGFIMNTAAAVPAKRRAVALGAGQAFDLPLTDLAKTFDELVLIDIDGEALAATVDETFNDPGLRAKVTPRVADLTGINAAFVDWVETALGDSSSLEEALDRMAVLCRSYRIDGRLPILASEENADFLVSSCVLTQLMVGIHAYAHRLFEARFGVMSEKTSRRWHLPWRELDLRMQQDHINALGLVATSVVLVSDLVVHTTDQAGRVVRPPVVPLAVEALDDRLPSHLAIGQQATWEWGRCRPTKTAHGLRADVGAATFGLLETNRSKSSVERDVAGDADLVGRNATLEKVR